LLQLLGNRFVLLLGGLGQEVNGTHILHLEKEGVPQGGARAHDGVWCSVKKQPEEHVTSVRD
jgi:hypothetical protein